MQTPTLPPPPKAATTAVRAQPTAASQQQVGFAARLSNSHCKLLYHIPGLLSSLSCS